MDADAMPRRAAERADELPGAVWERPFSDGTDAWHVGGKIFLLLMTVVGEPVVTGKAHPAAARELREAFPEITPGYHMNKRHWITLRAGGSLDEDMVEELVTESYLLVVENLPRRARPVDPETFGRYV